MVRKTASSVESVGRLRPRQLLKYLKQKNVEEVVDLLNLPAGWNSYSAKPIAPRNAIRTIRLLPS